MSTRTRFAALFALVLSLVLCCNSFVRADVAGARKALDDAKKNIEEKQWDEADTNLKLADAELDGVSGADKDAVAKDIAAVRQQMASVMSAGKTETVKKQIEIQLKDLKESLGNRTEAELAKGEVEKLLASDEGKLLTPAEADGYRKQLATLLKVSAQKSSERAVDDVKRRLDSAEADAATATGSDQTASRTRSEVLSVLDGMKDQIAILPDNDAGKALRDRAAKLRQKIEAAEGSANSSEYAAMMQRSWDSYKDEWTGWESEPDGPTFDEFKKESSESMSALRAPKTEKLISRANNWIEGNTKGEQYEAVKTDPAIKAMIEKVTQQRDAALAKMEARGEKIVASVEAEKNLKPDDGNQIDRISRDTLRLTMEGSPKLAALQARLDGVTKKIGGDVAANAAAKQKNLADLTKSAADAWPKIASSLSGKEGFDPNKISSGDTIRIKGKRNRLGWDFNPGDYDYACKINGVAIAGKFDSNVRGAFNDVTKKIGDGIPDEANWDVFAKVEGDGKISERKRADVSDTSGSRLGTVEGAETVDCKVIRIFAVYAGPLAVGPNGAADESGAVVAVAGAGASSSSGGWGWRFIMALFGIAGAAAVIVKIRPQAVAATVGQHGGAGGANALANVNKNLDYIGLLLAVLGILWLLRGLIIYDLFPAAALTACGLFVASDWLKGIGLVKDEQLAKIRPMGMLLVGATVILMVLHLLVGNWVFF